VVVAVRNVGWNYDRKSDLVAGDPSRDNLPSVIRAAITTVRKDFITVEVKEKSLTSGDVYQAKMYKEVFGARYGFLVTADPIPEELKRLCKATA
ncbi:MAG: hypothetical protein WCA38_02350, partial [Candidatus Acidiferrales bacterium]